MKWNNKKIQFRWIEEIMSPHSVWTQEKKSNTYRVKNERFAAPGEYLPKKDEESDRGFIEGEKKRTKHRKWREKKRRQRNTY